MLLVLMGSALWAGEMASSSFRIRRDEANSGGSNQSASAGAKLTDSAGSSGGNILSGAGEAVFVGIANVISHPNTILDMSAASGASLGELTITWTAPAAYGSTGTASSYWVKTAVAPIITEQDFTAAATLTQAWIPLAAGQGESHAVSGLAVNTTYYCSVKAMDQARNSAYISNVSGASTLTNPIAGGRIYSVSGTSIIADWQSLAGAGGAEGYRLETSTAGDFSGTIIFSSTTDVNVTTLTVSGLEIGKTYWLRAGGLNWNHVPNFVTLDGSPVTVVAGAAPANVRISNVYGSSMTVQWDAAPGSAGYSLEASLTDFGAVAASSVTFDAALSTLTFPSSLLPNTTYFIRVGALWNGATSYAAPTLSTSTLTNPIAGRRIYAVFYTSVTVNWPAYAVGSGAGTAEGYRIEASTMADFIPPAASSATDDVSLSTLTVQNLLPRTTYYFQVGAYNHNHVLNYVFAGSTTTIDVPTPVGLGGSAIGVSSISWGWGNLAIPGLSYNLYQATSPATLVYSGVSNTFVDVNLSTNAAYGRIVSAVISGVESPLSAPVITYTDAAVPGRPSFSNVLSTSFTATWSRNQNPVTTPYEVSLSTDNFVSNFSTPIAATDAFTANTTDFTNLAPGILYFVRVRAANEDGFLTDFSQTGSTRTLEVAAPGNFAGSAMGVSSISWTWDPAPRASYYNVYPASNPVTPIAAVATLGWIETGLSTNTAYGRVVSVVVGIVESPLSNSTTVYSRAATPRATTVGSVTTVSVKLGWDPHENPAGTLYQAEVSMPADFSSESSSFTTGTSVNFTPLLSNATYYLRVNAQNGDAITTPFDVTVTTLTPAATPVNGLISTVSTNTLSMVWEASTNNDGTVYQAELSTISAVGAATQTIAGLSVNVTFTGLTQNTTYYARVKALGWTGRDSAYLHVGQIATMLDAPTNLHFMDVQYSSVTVGWDLVAVPNLQYEAEMGYSNPFPVLVSSITLLSSADFSRLGPNQAYRFHVRSQDRTSLVYSVYSPVISTYTLAAAPVLLTTTSVASNSVGLAWEDGGNPAGTLYSVERSSDGVNFTPVNTMPGAAFMDVTVAAGTAYLYRIRAVNGNNVYSAASNIVAVMTAGIAVAPKRPSGLWTTRTSRGGDVFQVSYQWRRVTQRADGSALPNLAGYEIFTGPSLLTPRAQWTLLTTVTSESWATTTSPSAVTYYCIKAIDTNGLESDWTEVLDDGADMNHFFIYTDNISRIQAPQTAADKLRREHNNYGSDLWIEIEERVSEETGRVVRSMLVTLRNTDTGNAVTDMLFDPPVVRGTLAYSVQNGKIVAGAPEPAGSFARANPAVIAASNAADQLSLFWYNGAEWVKTSGQVNTADNTMSFTGARLGAYQIRAASHGSGATLTRVYPRIFTPNGDGWNDKAIFQFDNPQLLPLSGKIYDISGALVGSLKAGPNPDTSLAWDGKDAGGVVAPSGIYVYQIDMGGSLESGTVVVAR